MTDNKRNNYVGLAGTLLLHGVLLLFLWLFFIRASQPMEESGVPVMLGTEPEAEGGYRLTEVAVERPVARPASPQPAPKSDTPEMITQEDEETVPMESKKESPKQTNKETPEPATPELPKEKSEAEKRAEAEEAAAKAAAQRIAGAFGKGSAMGGGSENTTTGAQGSPTGDAAEGKSSGESSLGTFDLGGRSLEGGRLPVPKYNVQEEARVVVTITVNPEGQVIATSINKRTNTVNPQLRKAAEDAARRARFNAISGVNNQSGTITYYFRLK